jgi:hypothetical protein
MRRKVGTTLAALVLAGGAVLAAPTAATAATPSGNGNVHSVRTDGGVRPDDAGQCMDVLSDFGYGWTYSRFIACLVGQLGYPSTEKGYAACFAGLVGTGVAPFVAVYACTAALA